MNKNIKRLLVIIAVVFLLTGCTTVLKDNKTKKAVIYENDKVKITLNQNILCQPESKGLINKYNEYKKQIDISKLPKCKDFKVNDNNYEGIWETIFVKPLAWIIINANKFIGNYGVSIVIVGLIIRLILVPFTVKSLNQNENMKAMQTEMDRLNKKYEGKNDQESVQKKSMETMQLYKKYNINPLASCLGSFIQLPILIAFYEAINRVPVIFEGNLLGLVLGTTPLKAITSGHYEYIIIVLLIVLTTFIQQKLMKTSTSVPSNSEINPNLMMNMMVIMIAVMSINFSVALSLYWIASTCFNIVQSLILNEIKKRKKSRV